MKRWLVGKAVKSVDLKQLARVEDSILNHYKGFAAFRDLGQGSFLKFVAQHKELEALIAISAHTEDSALGVRKSDVIDLLRQCGVDSDKVSLKIMSMFCPLSFHIMFQSGGEMSVCTEYIYPNYKFFVLVKWFFQFSLL